MLHFQNAIIPHIWHRHHSQCLWRQILSCWEMENLNICNYFVWLWQILNLRRAGLSAGFWREKLNSTWHCIAVWSAHICCVTVPWIIWGIHSVGKSPGDCTLDYLGETLNGELLPEDQLSCSTSVVCPNPFSRWDWSLYKYSLNPLLTPLQTMAHRGHAVTFMKSIIQLINCINFRSRQGCTLAKCSFQFIHGCTFPAAPLIHTALTLKQCNDS